MTFEEVRNLPEDDVVALLEICRKGMRFQDGFWFMNVEDNWGLDRAVDLDADIWSRYGKYEAQLLLKSFNWNREGIPTLIKALRHAPSWLQFDCLIKQISETEAIFQVKKCLAQTGRQRVGRSVFPCRRVEEGYLDNFAKVIDPAIKVKCDFSPPDKYSDDLWCSWRFSIEPREKPSNHK